MAEIQNFGILPNVFTVNFLCFEDSKSKSTEICKPSDLKTLYDRIKKNENKSVCICLQFDGINRKLDLPKCLCLKTIYTICPLPNHLNDVAEDDLEKASISVHPPSNLNKASILKLSEKEIRSIKTYQLKHVYSFQENNLSSDNAKRSYRQKFGTAKVKKKCSLSRNCSYTSELNDDSKIGSIKNDYSNLCSTDFHETMTEHNNGRKNKSDINEINEDPNYYAMHTNDKNYKKHQACYVNKSTMTKKTHGNLSKDPCSTKHKSQRKQRKHNPQLFESSSESETSLRPCTFLKLPCITNCMPVKKGQKPSNLYNNKDSRKDCGLPVSREQPAQVKHCPCCTHSKTIDKETDLKLSTFRADVDEQFLNLGKGVIELNGKSYEAIIKLVASNEKNDENRLCAVDSYSKQKSQHSIDSHKQDRYSKILPIISKEKLPMGSTTDLVVKQPNKSSVPVLVHKSEKAEYCPSELKDSKEVKKNRSCLVKKSYDNIYGHLSSSDDDDTIPTLVFADEPSPHVEARPQKAPKVDAIPGFSFKLDRCKLEVDKASNLLIDKKCLIRDQEEERFLHQTNGMQPLTIIMNEPYNIPLRIYEVSPSNQQRYLSTKK